MTAFVFYQKRGRMTGFTLSGHSTADAADLDGRLICAAVSSAAYMAANTVTDVLKTRADASEGDAEMKLGLLEDDDRASAVLEGLLLHIRKLSEQYPKNLTFSVKEI